MIAFLSIVNMFNLICGTFSLLTSLLILKKDPKNWFNRLLFLTFFCWALNIFLYSFVYLAVVGEGVVNLLRDVNVFFGVTSAFFLLLSGYYLAYGADEALKPRTIIFIGLITIVLILIALINDNVVIVNLESVIQTSVWGSICIFIIPGLAALMGVGFFFQVYRRLESGSPIRLRVLFFILGALLLILGAILFGVEGIIIPGQENPVLTYIATGLWALGPVCIVWGLYAVKTTN